MSHLDCGHLLTVEGHLAAVVQLVDAVTCTGGTTFDGPLTEAWQLANQWLRMAAGLEHVEIDLASFDAPYMCGTAMDYQEAANRAASLFVCEYTRLLYTANATELLLGAMDLPPVPGITGMFSKAAARVTAAFTDTPPSHYRGILRHLRDHIERDPNLRSDKRLMDALQERPWRGESALLLSVSQQLRHVLAHGALRMPEPERWDHEECDDVEPIELARLHVPRLGVRGLLLGLQMVLWTLLSEDSRTSSERAEIPVARRGLRRHGGRACT